jgi:hypothetical protein
VLGALIFSAWLLLRDTAVKRADEVPLSYLPPSFEPALPTDAPVPTELRTDRTPPMIRRDPPVERAVSRGSNLPRPSAERRGSPAPSIALTHRKSDEGLSGLSRGTALRAIRSRRGHMAHCLQRRAVLSTAEATVRVTLEKEGRVAAVEAAGVGVDAAALRCLENAVRPLRVHAFEDGPVHVTYRVPLSGGA